MFLYNYVPNPISRKGKSSPKKIIIARSQTENPLFLLRSRPHVNLDSIHICTETVSTTRGSRVPGKPVCRLDIDATCPLHGSLFSHNAAAYPLNGARFAAASPPGCPQEAMRLPEADVRMRAIKRDAHPACSWPRGRVGNDAMESSRKQSRSHANVSISTRTGDRLKLCASAVHCRCCCVRVGIRRGRSSGWTDRK
jgi:hypothetical protein